LVSFTNQASYEENLSGCFSGPTRMKFDRWTRLV
jgi:hypothetical protein